jgi:diguanylate cyclase (GGDEF)-like protein
MTRVTAEVAASGTWTGMVHESPDVGASAPAGAISEILDGFEDPAALLDTDGDVVAVNRAWKAHGVDGVAFADGDREPVDEVLRGERVHRAAARRRAARDGWRWYRSRVRRVAGIPGVAAVLTHRDVTDERRLQLRMAQSPVAHLELAVDGALLNVNERWEELRGRPVGAELGLRWLRDTPEDERVDLLARLERPEPFACTLTTSGADDRTRCIELELEPVFDADEWIGWHASATDVTEVRQLEAAADGALTDDLTGVANRGLFERAVERALNRRPEENPSAVLFVDLDRFKPVNDAHGHAAGDVALQQIARRITSALRPADLVARYGGDEFAVLLEPADGDFARQVGERLVDAVCEPLELHGAVVDVGASVGIALTRPGDDVATVVGRADQAMYVAKRGGGCRVELAPPEARASTSR